MTGRAPIPVRLNPLGAVAGSALGKLTLGAIDTQTNLGRMRDCRQGTAWRYKFSTGDNAGTLNLALHIQKATGEAL